MIEQKIKDAVSEALSHCQRGVDINEAIIKSSSHLPIEGVKRVAESINVSNFLSLLESGEDKKTQFPIADPMRIVEKMGSDALHKTAMLKPQESGNANSFYAKHVPAQMEKVAHYEPERPILPENIIKNEFSKKAYLQKRDEVMRDAFLSYEKNFAKHFDMMKKACNSMDFSDPARARVVCKAAYNIEPRSASYLPVLFPETCSSSMEKVAYVIDNDEMVKPVVELSGYFDNLIKISKLKEKPVVKQAKDDKKAKSVTDLMFGGLGTMLQGALKGGQKRRETLMSQPTTDKNKGSDAKLALQYKRNFEDLITEDEILREKDPKELANMYQSMIRVAPRISADKEIAKAHLRQVGGQAVMGPYEAGILADLENRLFPS